jgi:uncharacterized membrane protein
MLNLMLIGGAVFIELVSFVFYSRYKSRFRKLKGTGRIADMEIAHNWQYFFGFVLLAIPCLCYYMY